MKPVQLTNANLSELLCLEAELAAALAATISRERILNSCLTETFANGPKNNASSKSADL